jgi:four helix bundle protein
LKVWQKAHQLVLALYQITDSFPRAENFGLTVQIRRAAVSIPSNLAEGCGREGDAELARFCRIARGSASELEYHLLLARDLKLIQTNDHQELEQQTTQIKRMLTVFVQKLTAES